MNGETRYGAHGHRFAGCIFEGVFSMDLILVRHARAFDRDASAWPDDSRRPLTAEGREEFVRLAKRLRRIYPTVDLLESSSYTRAWQTAQLLAEHAGWPKPSRLERLEGNNASGSANGASAEAVQLESLLRTVRALRGIGAVAWVGHEPLLSRFASQLLAGSPGAVRIAFKKGAAIALRLPETHNHDEHDEHDEHDAERARAGRGHEPPMNAAHNAASTLRADLLWMATPAMARAKRGGKRGGRR